MMDDKTYQLMLDDLGELVDLLNLPLGEMMNQSPRQVLLDCITAVQNLQSSLAEVRAERDRWKYKSARGWADAAYYERVGRYWRRQYERLVQESSQQQPPSQQAGAHGQEQEPNG